MLKDTLAEVLFRTEALSAARMVACAVDRLLKRSSVCPEWERGGLIFMFHAVAETPSPFRLAISRDAFDGFCRLVAEHYEVLPLAELESCRRAGTLPSRAIAITFDDGFADNHDVAWPVLKRYKLPATLFVTTGAVGGERLLWFHRLAHIFETTAPKELPVCVGPWTFALDTDAERAKTVVRVAEDLKRRDPTEREEILAELSEAFGVTDFSPLAREMLTWEQIRAMDAAGFSVEAHTVSHPILSTMPIEMAAREIAESREALCEELRRPIEYFAYPNGKRDDVTEEVARAVEGAGFRAAFTSEFGAAFPSSDAYRVPRVSVYSNAPASLSLQVERCFYHH